MALRHITRPEGETVPDLYDFVDYLLREYHHSEPFEDRISSDAILTPLQGLDEEGRLKVSVMLSRLAGKIATESLESMARARAYEETERTRRQRIDDILYSD